MLTYLQAIVIALVQGVTELFPVSSLGHSVLVPAWIGGSWETLVTQSSQPHSESSFYLAFIVALHVATALALLWLFRADWIRIIAGFLRTARRAVTGQGMSVRDSDERLAWLIILATIPVGITGLVLEHVFRTAFAKPVAASAFLFLNGLILLAGDRARRAQHEEHDEQREPPEPPQRDLESDRRLARMPWLDGLLIGSLQTFALFAGISRSGITMVGGLFRGLSHEDAARFAFLLATPVILAAGVLKVPSLFGSAGDHIHGQVAVGFVICGVTAYFSAKYLLRYFETRSLRPFAIYCLAVGAISFLRFV
jgi:undecaprenyl-diphosphatase